MSRAPHAALTAIPVLRTPSATEPVTALNVGLLPRVAIRLAYPRVGDDPQVGRSTYDHCPDCEYATCRCGDAPECDYEMLGIESAWSVPS